MSTLDYNQAITNLNMKIRRDVKFALMNGSLPFTHNF